MLCLRRFEQLPRVPEGGNRFLTLVKQGEVLGQFVMQDGTGLRRHRWHHVRDQRPEPIHRRLRRFRQVQAVSFLVECAATLSQTLGELLGHAEAMLIPSHGKGTNMWPTLIEEGELDLGIAVLVVPKPCRRSVDNGGVGRARLQEKLVRDGAGLVLAAVEHEAPQQRTRHPCQIRRHGIDEPDEIVKAPRSCSEVVQGDPDRTFTERELTQRRGEGRKPRRIGRLRTLGDQHAEDLLTDALDRERHELVVLAVPLQRDNPGTPQ